MSRKAKKQASRKKGRSPRLLAVGQFIVLAGVLLSVGLFSAYLGMRVAVRGTEVEVPSVLGDSLESATRKLEAIGLRREVMGERFEVQVPKNSVISQSPQPGTPIKAGQKVQLILSRGEKTSPVPDLIGSSVRVAGLLAGEAGFQIGNMSRVALEGVERDRVIQQFPAPHSVEFLSPRIDILISSGFSRSNVMPKIVGQPLSSVLRFLENNHLEVGRVQYRRSRSLQKGQVIKQFPEPGFMLTEAEPINLEVAR